MTAVYDFAPKDFDDDPNYHYQLTSSLDQEELKDARAIAVDNIENAGSSVPRAFLINDGDASANATPATELSGNEADDTEVRRVDLTPAEAEVEVGDTVALTATVYPSWAADDEVSFASNKTAIATVNSSTGVVTGVATSAKATATVTSDATNVSDGDTVTINGQVYTFKTTPAAAYDVDIGASAAATLDNLKAAINASGTPGTEYFAGTLIHPTVSATTNTDTVQTLEAKTGGTDGNDLTLAESSSHLTVSGATFSGGADTAIITVTTTDGSFTDTAEITVIPAS